MPPAARVTDMTGHGTPMGPGPGSPNVLIGSQPAWRATPAGVASAIENFSQTVSGFMKRPAMTPTDAAADLANITAAMGQTATAAAGEGAVGAPASATAQSAGLVATNTTLTATWTAASAAPGGMAPATTAYTEGIKAAVAGAASAVMSAMSGIADMHVCPVPTPAPPHGPGFVTRGSGSVTINNLAAARQGDKIVETCGGQDPVAVGFSPVLIGG